VNGENVTVREFQSRAKATREQLVNQYIYYYQMAMMFGIDPSTDSSLSQVFTNIQNQLDSPDTIANQVLSYIEDDLFIKQYARENQITITDAEVEAEIQNTFSYFPQGTQTPTPSPTSFTYSTLSAEQLFLVTATPTSTTAPTLTATALVTKSPTVTPAPSATPMTEGGFADSYQKALENYRALGFSEKLFRQVFFENALYRKKVQALVTADVPHEAEQVWARHILVADEATAKAIYSLLMDGVDFAKLASEYSTDTGSKSKGGDLGWFGRGTMVAEFETAAYSLDIGEISQPVQSQNGFHIIQVLGHEIRPLTAEEYKKAVDAAFNTWLEARRAESTIVVNPDLLSYVPTKPTLQDAFNNLFATQTVAASTSIVQQQTADAILALTPSSTPLPPTATP
jgi:peptidyl-prolyl cis-trans isomerase D